MRHLPILDASPPPAVLAVAAGDVPEDPTPTLGGGSGDAFGDVPEDPEPQDVPFTPYDPASRPTKRGECLTARRRYELDVMYASTPSRVPAPGGRDAQGFPTDGGPDGWNCARPCPFVGCKSHLAVDYNPITGTATLPYGGGDEEDDNEPGGASVSPDVRAYIQTERTLARLEWIGRRLAAWEALQRARALGTGDGEPVERFPPPHLHTCGLDLADIGHEQDGLTLEAVGDATARTRERIRQVQSGALAHLRDSGLIREMGAREGEEEHPVQGTDAPRRSITLPSGVVLQILRASASSLVVACENPTCGTRFTIREPRLLALGYAYCKTCRAAKVPPPVRTRTAR